MTWQRNAVGRQRLLTQLGQEISCRKPKETLHPSLQEHCRVGYIAGSCAVISPWHVQVATFQELHCQQAPAAGAAAAAAGRHYAEGSAPVPDPQVQHISPLCVVLAATHARASESGTPTVPNVTSLDTQQGRVLVPAATEAGWWMTSASLADLAVDIPVHRLASIFQGGKHHQHRCLQRWHRGDMRQGWVHRLYVPSTGSYSFQAASSSSPPQASSM